MEALDNIEMDATSSERLCSSCQVRRATWVVEFLQDTYAFVDGYEVITEVVKLTVRKCAWCLTDQEARWIQNLYLRRQGRKDP